MLDYLLAFALILIMMLGWILVQQAARRFAHRYPQFGPAKEGGSGCCKSCCCNGSPCERKKTELTVSGGEHDPLK